MRRNELSEWIFNLVVLIFATSSIAQPFVIPSGSMESTLMTGDHVIVDKLAYAPADSFSRHLLPYETIKQGDIIVFRYPVDEKENFIKRVVGVPGDRIHLDNGRVIRNGVPLTETYAQHIATFPDPYRDNFPNARPTSQVYPRAIAMLQTHSENGDLVVPPGNYFAMGDNRDNSSDSRYWGLVPAQNIVGKPVFVFWSYEAEGEELTDVVNVHHILDVATHFFTKTRWNRTFRVVRAN